MCLLNLCSTTVLYPTLIYMYICACIYIYMSYMYIYTHIYENVFLEFESVTVTTFNHFLTFWLSSKLGLLEQDKNQCLFPLSIKANPQMGRVSLSTSQTMSSETKYAAAVFKECVHVDFCCHSLRLWLHSCRVDYMDQKC